MLITDRFVMLNFPKTGSSFARSVLKELHAPNAFQRFLGSMVRIDSGLREELVVPYRFKPARHSYPSQHGVYSQIPALHRNKTIMSIMRDPLDRMISAYEFKHWTRYQEAHIDRIRERFPAFPELTFEDWVEFNHSFIGSDPPPVGMQTEVGPLTVMFVRFFARDPQRTMLSLRDGSDLAAERDEHFPAIRFLHMEDLREELTAFLLEMGYAPERLTFIKDKQRVNTTGRTRPDYLTPRIVDRVLHAERFLYQLLPEYLPQRNTA